ncbi:MAG: hypothetical protein J6Q53_07815 [Oscillospiraceae bacterium]|nr:hypothetical protein [Oscillospiraceae bacterium]
MVSLQNEKLCDILTVINHPPLADKPMILQPPNEQPGYQRKVALLRSMAR